MVLRAIHYKWCLYSLVQTSDGLCYIVTHTIQTKTELQETLGPFTRSQGNNILSGLFDMIAKEITR